MDLSVLDQQMKDWSDRLVADVKVTDKDCRILATTIAADVRFLPKATKEGIIQSSPVSVRERYEELIAFQSWMDSIRGTTFPPEVRAQVLAGNYVCFVYLPEFFFKIMFKAALSGSALRKCCKFLTHGRVRSFRNAIAHSNWRYREDFGALQYWARKDEANDASLCRFEVENGELSFWQALSRCVAYSAIENLR